MVYTKVITIAVAELVKYNHFLKYSEAELIFLPLYIFTLFYGIMKESQRGQLC